jgi:hypothetical protein
LAFSFLGVVEGLRNQLPGAFGDLAGTLDRAHPNILAGLSSAFAEVPGRAYRMQRHKVACSFTHPLGGLACAFAYAFADITRTPTDIAARALPLRWSCGLGLGGPGLRGRRLSLRRILTVKGNAKSQRGQEQKDERCFHEPPPPHWMLAASSWLRF